jgi:hypothetical protein
MRLVPGRSFFYGLFLWATSFGWLTLWTPIIVQSLATFWIIHLVLRCHDLPSGPFATTIFSMGLGLATSVPWYTCQLMPDILVPLTVMALWLLGFCGKRLQRREQAGLTVLALLGLLSHMSSMALALGLAGLTLGVWILKRMGRVSVSCRVFPVAVVASSLILMPLLHLTIMGKATFTPGGPIFIFGSLVQQGIAQRWLGEHCPVPGIALCNLIDRLPRTADEFLWDNSSPFQEIGGWKGAEEELGHLVKECVKAYPGTFVMNSAKATLQQLAMVATGDGLDEFHGATRGIFAEYLPFSAKSFNSAYQQQGKINQLIFHVLNRLHVPIAYLSVFGLILAIFWELHRKRYDLVGLALYVSVALLGNAFICGALSNPHDRYQNRLVWLATMVVGMTVVRWRQLQGGKKGVTHF